MKKYLESEAALWGAFLEYFEGNFKESLNLATRYENIGSQKLASALDDLALALTDRTKFNQSTAKRNAGHIYPPPPSSSIEGQVILALFLDGMKQRALAAYVHFIIRDYGQDYNSPYENYEVNKTGARLIEAAYVAHVLPYDKVASEKLADTTRTADAHIEAFSHEVARAQDINEEHTTRLTSFFGSYKAGTERLDTVFRYLNKRRARHHQKLILDNIKQVSDHIGENGHQLKQLREINEANQTEQDAEFKRLRTLFETQLRLRAPVKLWETRQELHSDNSKTAMVRFVIAVAITIAFGLVVPFWFGDYIASSFFESVCAQVQADAPQTCERLFSAKGPLTVTGLLLVTSLLMWVARLQYRIHLSERHLALDASEKKAFAETYLAMKEGEDVGKDNEAIVLASLFRPTQDGIIRDDETGMDISAAAVLAKQFSRN